jgi:hypothetical protein
VVFIRAAAQSRRARKRREEKVEAFGRAHKLRREHNSRQIGRRRDLDLGISTEVHRRRRLQPSDLTQKSRKSLDQEEMRRV